MKLTKSQKPSCSTVKICRVFGKSRQAYFKRLRFTTRREGEEAMVMELVCKERKILASMGGRKLHFKIMESLRQEGLHVGRDRLFAILRKNGALIVCKKRFVKTTNSAHSFRKYKDIFNGTPITSIEQAFVSDITYIPLGNSRFGYVAFVTDAFSRKIMGYSVGDKIDTQLALEALVMAINNRRLDTDLMHHSDRDGRYCSAEYTRLLKAYGVKISMTESGDPRDNAIAERLNGIIKQEFGLKKFSGSLDELTRLIDEAVYLYNTYRPHLSCDYKTPEEVHSSYTTPVTLQSSTNGSEEKYGNALV